MYNWFEVKVSYEKYLESGMQAKVTEPYMFDALSYTEAEARTLEELKPYISGEFTIADIRRPRISETFFNENGDRWYLGKLYMITLDEKTCSEKKQAVKVLAQASDFKEAMEVITKGMEGTLADWTMAELKETAIMDVFPYSAENKIEEEPQDPDPLTEKDPLLRKAIELARKDKDVSPNMLRMKLQIGQRRVEKLLNLMQEEGAVIINKWEEKFIDEDSGESVPIERRDITYNEDYRLPDE